MSSPWPGREVVSVGPNGKQKPFAVTISGGAFGIPIGIAYDRNHSSTRRSRSLRAAAIGRARDPEDQRERQDRRRRCRARRAWSQPTASGLDSATGNMYVTDIFGNAIWRITPGGSAQLWTSAATNPLLVLPDGVKVFKNAVYISIEAGRSCGSRSTPTAARARRPSGRRFRARCLLRRHGARRSHRRRLRDAARHGRAAADHAGRCHHTDRDECGRAPRRGEHDPDPRRSEHGHLPREHAAPPSAAATTGGAGPAILKITIT